LRCRLTEEDTEYAIHAVKHVFPEHLVLQFDCTNTIAEQCLENVSVMLDLADAVRYEIMRQCVGWAFVCVCMSVCECQAVPFPLC
jgi:hypothetical protein